MLKLVLVTALVTLLAPLAAYANRSLENDALSGLVALDAAPPSLNPLRAAFTAVNERGLDVLPAAATLRAENALATATLAVVH